MTIKKLKLLPLCNSILSLVHLQEKITKIIQIYSAHTISLPDKSTFCHTSTEVLMIIVVVSHHSRPCQWRRNVRNFGGSFTKEPTYIGLALCVCLVICR